MMLDSLLVCFPTCTAGSRRIALPSSSTVDCCWNDDNRLSNDGDSSSSPSRQHRSDDLLSLHESIADTAAATPSRRRRGRRATGDITGTGASTGSGLTRWTLLRSWLLFPRVSRRRQQQHMQLHPDHEDELFARINAQEDRRRRSSAEWEETGRMGEEDALPLSLDDLLAPRSSSPVHSLQRSRSSSSLGEMERDERRRLRRMKKRARELGLTLQQFERGIAASESDLITPMGEDETGADGGGETTLARPAYTFDSSSPPTTTTSSHQRRHPYHQPYNHHYQSFIHHDETDDVEPPSVASSSHSTSTAPSSASTPSRTRKHRHRPTSSKAHHDNRGEQDYLRTDPRLYSPLELVNEQHSFDFDDTSIRDEQEVSHYVDAEEECLQEEEEEEEEDRYAHIGMLPSRSAVLEELVDLEETAHQESVSQFANIIATSDFLSALKQSRLPPPSPSTDALTMGVVKQAEEPVSSLFDHLTGLLSTSGKMMGAIGRDGVVAEGEDWRGNSDSEDDDEEEGDDA